LCRRANGVRTKRRSLGESEPAANELSEFHFICEDGFVRKHNYSTF